ncbi:MAG: hypothetical protein EPN69_02530 [Rhodanobacter sp.]|nr:MAG: hypothetical protein EPN71_10190 [Rhodanobacter sp.]TAL98062.1 MAG: hypothetical protein EPN69_02530 [Rhodanobacter sp.]TAM38484.1 MAG: hypothetical protein EPN58_16920 [Rhodanobacter sp.]TAN27050.1 MAG: hypothetical protein EPN32_05035 [Rhodanobacter sp.]
MTPLITALTNPDAYRHPAPGVEIIETHISWVLLAGDYAYKIKKPVVLPFVDFGTLAARHRYCEDEVRLNCRLAPHVYLGVVPITGSVKTPIVDGRGTVLEYAVKMRRFEQDALFDHMLARGALNPELIDGLAERIAAFHAKAPATTSPDFGTPDKVLQPALDNFSEMLPHADSARRARLDALADWTRQTFARLEPVFAARHRDGWVRECHGDLHLRNIALIDGCPVPFDCIEFSTEFRWIDVINEAAFLVMDLMDRGRSDLGYRFLDGYLAASGDYAGVSVLRFYLVYRALVRAKIHDLRAHQANADPHEVARLQAAADHYLTLAHDIARAEKPALILMHGFSGAGKSRVAAALTEAHGAIRLRSDVERKRLFGLDASARSHSDLNAGIYNRESGTKTYARLAELAQTILTAGYPAIVDAAFLARWQREPMRELADRLGAPLRIVDCTADSDTLRERVSARAARGDDASEATLEVLERQMTSHEPFTTAEQAQVVRCAMEGAEAGSVAACVENVVSHLSDPGCDHPPRRARRP